MTNETAPESQTRAIEAQTPEPPVAKPKLVVFHRFIPGAMLPQRADKSAIGTMPTRAFRYCEAIVSASAFGYYIFPPINFSLIWNGTEVMWKWEGEAAWHPLKVAQFPDYRPYFDANVPEEIREFSPPFLGAMNEAGIVQIWSGMVARTAPGISLLIRPLANLPRSQYYELYEGIIETDRWFGPLFTNIRLTKTDVEIQFRADYPLFQVQPIPREVYADSTLNDYELVPELHQMQPEDWDDFYDTVVRPNVQTDRPRGAYAAAARKRRSGDERG